MEWTSLDTWIVATGMLSAMACALPGCYLVLRRMSMMGDAISHAVLPGLAAAFLISGSRGSLAMMAGAVLIGVVTAFLIQALDRLGGMDRGASMGVIFTTLFALGLVLIRQAADRVDLDPSCVLYGAIELTPLDVYAFGGIEVPRAAVTNAAMLLLKLSFILLFFTELKITSFDPALATTIGISADRMHYALMTLVAATTIAASESVGSILVIAMLIVPGATAHLLTDRLSPMLALSLLIACLSALLGHVGAITVPGWFGLSDTSTAGMMSVAAGAVFLAVFLFAPRHGVAGRALGRLALSMRIQRDDILAFLYRVEELAPAAAPTVRVSDVEKAMEAPGAVRLALRALTRQGLIRRTAAGVCLTEEGRRTARSLVRSHRLWEAYLCDRMGFCAADVHEAAHRLEHVTGPAMQAQLAEAAGHPTRDPHDRRIP